MKINVVAFGVAKDILGKKHIEMEIDKFSSVGAYKQYLIQNYEGFAKLKSFAIAINEEYANDDQQINISDEIVIIPPVSGG